jgi:hypothetical protein
MINPNSKDEAEAFQSLLVSGITENTRYVWLSPGSRSSESNQVFISSNAVASYPQK